MNGEAEEMKATCSAREEQLGEFVCRTCEAEQATCYANTGSNTDGCEPIKETYFEQITALPEAAGSMKKAIVVEQSQFETRNDRHKNSLVGSALRS